MSAHCASTGAAPVEDGLQTPLIGPVSGPELHVMSWNIRRKVPERTARAADSWEGRAPRLRSLLRTERPSLLGVQEALPEQSEFVAESMGSRYRSVGHGRNADGSGEGSPLFYDEKRLELLDWEQLALSSTPNRLGSRSWGNMIPRMLVTATFQDREGPARFLVVNTHFDHISRTSRVHSAQAIGRLVAQKGLPAVVMGDLNAGATSAPLRELLTAGRLVDSWAVAASQESKEWGTFPNYQQPRLGRKRIDWILLTPEVRVLRAAINPQGFADGWASDHLPVQSVLSFPAADGNP
ncbi:endonuclease/exonuclease/phosphatase family protein [Specibacter sp. NPDC057265]|uniref:endonuclease/exonuclease/phosphatase family protein n=1 Tax=Specibacter sp. NPDC057265 TaxID=3346075 RepID=UPI00363C1BEB